MPSIFKFINFWWTLKFMTQKIKTSISPTKTENYLKPFNTNFSGLNFKFLYNLFFLFRKFVFKKKIVFSIFLLLCAVCLSILLASNFFLNYTHLIQAFNHIEGWKPTSCNINCRQLLLTFFKYLAKAIGLVFSLLPKIWDGRFVVNTATTQLGYVCWTVNCSKPSTYNKKLKKVENFWTLY